MLGRRGGMGYEEGELELEEGEAAALGGAGSVYGNGGGEDDPDALTYIDEKVQNLLGHFRKKFEGVLSVKNLGPLYGHTGSFLPAYPCSPLVFPQYRSPAEPQNHGSASRSPYLTTETVQKIHFVKTELDSDRKNDHYQVSNECNGNLSQQMLNRAVNGCEQKAPKIRIKVNKNTSLSRNTAAIYSGLGLDISPSSSTEDNLDGTAEAPAPEVLLGESPRTIFEIMTCHFIPGGQLLSPLTGNFLELRQKPKSMIKHEVPEFHDDKAEFHRDGAAHTTSTTLDTKDKSAMEIKSDEKKDRVPNFKSSKCRVNRASAVNKGTKPQLPDVSDDTGSNLPTVIKIEHSVEEPQRSVGEISDEMQGSKKGSLKGHIGDKNKDSKKESSLDHGFSCKISYDSEEYNNQPSTNSSHLENIPSKTLSLERNKEKVAHVKEEHSQYKTEEMGSLFGVESMDIMAGNVDRNSSGLIKGKNKKVPSSQGALPGKKIKFKAQKQLNEDRDRKSNDKDEDYGLYHRTDLVNSYTKDKSVELDKRTISSGETSIKSGVGNGGGIKISPLIDNKSDPSPLVHRNGTTESSTALTTPAPIVINEQWVCCDKCENWRLLPYGMNPDILPKKWRCSMQSWLPGMNSCKITEDETTRALRALYMVPVPESNIKDGGHGNAMSGIDTASAPTFKGNMQSISTSGKLKGSHDRANVANTFDLADMSKPSKKPHASSRNPDGVDCFPKLKEKRKMAESSDKGEIVEKDQSHPMRSSVGVDHDNLRASKKMKKESNVPVTKHQPLEFKMSKNSPPANVTLKNMQKRSNISAGMGKYGSCSSGKHSHGEGKGFSDGVIKMSDAENSDLLDPSIKKRKLKQRQSQHDLDLGHSNTDTNAKQNIIETTVVKKKPRPELKLSKTDRTAAHSIGTLTGTDDDKIYAYNECLSEQRQENTRFQYPLLSESSTRRNVCHATSTAATSSSSKVSNSHMYKADFQEMRPSPVESVSSSPLRTSDKNSLDRHRSYSLAVAENVHSQESRKKSSSCSNRIYDLGSDSDQAKAPVSGFVNGHTDHHVQNNRDLLKDKQDLTNACLINKGSGLSIKNIQLNPEHKVNPDALSLNNNHDHNRLTGRQNGKTPPRFDSSLSDHANLTCGNIEPDKGKVPHNDLKTNPPTVKGSKHQHSLNNASNGDGDAPYKAKQIEKKSIVEKRETRKQLTLDGDTSNLTNASVLLKEARDLKHLSNRLKEKGHYFESTSMCFEAGLKFLHVASLWEGPTVDSSKQGDSVQATKLYSETGILFVYCASEFERLKKMANAALAYKCVEVAYMKAAFFKHTGAIKDRHALQATSLMVPPAESPSSSASDIDNLNNQSTVAKDVSARGVYSPQVASNPISRNNHHLMGLLSYAEDTHIAFEGTKKSRSSFSAYLSGTGKNKANCVSLVREVLDFSFYDVKGLLRLIRHSLESINHESFK
ncbi:unnamed protein product [Urochloa decumbens]|uniref:CW-type domain-containing protein n=1 Tax=Urochloa decumbens TaxID=240449 RepID=A0ABC8WCY7_9POAL